MGEHDQLVRTADRRGLPSAGDVGQCGGDLPRALALREDRTVGRPAGEFERTRADDARHDRRWLGGRMDQANALDVHGPPVDVGLLTREERAHGGDGLLQQRERAGGRRAHPRHPLGHTVPDPGDETAGERAGQGGELHAEQGRVAQGCGGDADADADTGRRGQGQRRRGDGPGPRQILDHPQVVRPLFLHRGGEVGEVFWALVPVEHYAEAGPAGRQSGHSPTVRAGRGAVPSGYPRGGWGALSARPAGGCARIRQPVRRGVRARR